MNSIDLAYKGGKRRAARARYTCRVLSQEVLKQRLAAARFLRGYTQAQLGEFFDKDGLDKTAPGRIERGDITMKRAHRRALCEHLRVPDRWFSEGDVDALVGYPDPADISDEQLKRLGAVLVPQLLAAVRALRREQGPARQGKDEPDLPPADEEGGDR